MRLAMLSLLPIALLTVGCDDEIAPPAQGGWYVNFVSGGSSCSQAVHSSQLGDVSKTSKTELASNGTGDSEVECEVTASKISGKAEKKSVLLDILVPSISSDATIDDPAEGFVTYQSPQTVNAYSSPTDMPCEFWFDEGTDQGIQAGEAWVAFKCGAVSADGNTCAISQGYAAFAACN